MATYTWTRTAVDSTVVGTWAPNGNYSAQTAVAPRGQSAGAVVLDLGTVPNEYAQKNVRSVTYYAYGKNSGEIISGTTYAGELNVVRLRYLDVIDLSNLTWGEVRSAWFRINSGDSDMGSTTAWYSATAKAITGEKFIALSGNFVSNSDEDRTVLGWTIYTAKSSYKPYAVFTLDDIDVYAYRPSPTSGYVNEKETNTFNWYLRQRVKYGQNTVETASSPVEQMPGQKSALIEWKTVGSSTVNSITVTGSTTSATIPANTFPTSAQIQWRVTVTSTDNVVGTPSDWYTLTTVDSTDMTATPTAPVSTYLDGSAPQVFSWSYAISTGSAPSGYRLQYSADAGTSWITFSTGTGSATSATVPANTFPAGSILWRVSAANSDGAWSEWSAPAQIVVVAAPPAPSLSVDATTARPVFSWQSEGQVAWDLNLTDSTGAVIFDTGATYGAAKGYQSPEFLPNGNYTVTLTVVNQYGISSDPAVAGFSLSLPALTPPTAEANASGESVVITASTEGFETLYVLRNGIPIGVMNGGEFTDFSALGVNLYTVRGVTADGNFADSEPVAAQVEVKGTVLTSTEDPQQMIRLWLRKGADTVRDSSLTLTSASTHYAGRSLPVVEFSEFVDENLQFAFSFVERSKIQSLSALIKAGKTLLYRDHAGDRFFITVSSVRFDRDHIAQDFTISAQKVDFVEKISY